jgi:hypothetical protein
LWGRQALGPPTGLNKLLFSSQTFSHHVHQAPISFHTLLSLAPPFASLLAWQGASTDARVYIEMYGPYDSVTTGDIRLVNADSHQRSYTRGALDLFIVSGAPQWQT